MPPLIWRLMWPNIGTYWHEIYNMMGKIHWIGLEKLLFILTRVLIQRWFHITSFAFLSHKGYLEEYANGFQHLCPCIIKLHISISDKVEWFLAWLKEDVWNKVLVDLKGDGGPWEDIKHLIHYAITIDTTYAQATKGRKDTKPQSNVLQPKGHIGHSHATPTFTRRHKLQRSSPPQNIDMKDGHCFICHHEGHMACNCP